MRKISTKLICGMTPKDKAIPNVGSLPQLLPWGPYFGKALVLGHSTSTCKLQGLGGGRVLILAH